MARSGWVVGVVALMLGLSGDLLGGLSAGAQSGATGGEKKEVIATGGVLSSLTAEPVMGQPYSAMVVHQTSRKLTDGTTISQKGHHFVARDSQGRVHVEMRMTKGQKGEPDTVMVFVSDPVAHTITTWVSGPKIENKVASVVKVPSQRKPEGMAQPRVVNDSRPQPVVTTEDLGTVMLEGLPVTDVKTTTVVPVGRAGNDAPITKTHEVWTSQDLKLVMKQRSEDPRTGVMTVELEEFSRAEPDPALFRAPKGYTVKNALESLKELEEKLSAAQN
jgi:hypothetical protein